MSQTLDPQTPGKQFEFNVQGESYTLKRYLGNGSFGQVVEVIQKKTKQTYAMKVIRHEHAFHQQGLVELQMLKTVQERFPDEPTVLQLKLAFCLNNAYPTKGGPPQMKMHLCLVFPKFEMTLTHLLRGDTENVGFSYRRASHITMQLTHALDCLRKAGVIHRDVKPDNIMIRNPPVGELVDVCLIDFGSACYNDATPKPTYCQSRFYRAPEVILGHHYSTDVDMWSLGCVAVEMLFGKPLFLGKNEEMQLTLINYFIGPFPNEMIQKGSAPLVHTLFQLSSCLDRYEQAYYQFTKPPIQTYWKEQTLRKICVSEPMPKPIKGVEMPVEEIRECFAHFIEGCLRIDYTKRWIPSQADGHPWLKVWSEPESASELNLFCPRPRGYSRVERSRMPPKYGPAPQRRRHSVGPESNMTLRRDMMVSSSERLEAPQSMPKCLRQRTTGPSPRRISHHHAPQPHPPARDYNRRSTVDHSYYAGLPPPYHKPHLSPNLYPPPHGPHLQQPPHQPGGGGQPGMQYGWDSMFNPQSMSRRV